MFKTENLEYWKMWIDITQKGIKSRVKQSKSKIVKKFRNILQKKIRKKLIEINYFSTEIQKDLLC